jgi:hypothetical protein
MVDNTLLVPHQVYRSTSSGHRRNDNNDVQQTHTKVSRSTGLSRCMLRTHHKQDHNDVHTQEERQPEANGMSKEIPIKQVHSCLNQETTLKL